MLEIPLHRFAQAVFECVRRCPSELAADLRRVDRVAAIVAGAIGDELLQPSPALGAGPQRIDRVADAIDNLQVRSLVAAADVVLLSEPAGSKYGQQSRAVVVHVQPVADMATVAVNRQRPVLDRVQDRERNQLFGKLKRAVVVRAVRDKNRHLVRTARTTTARFSFPKSWFRSRS